MSEFYDSMSDVSDDVYANPKSFPFLKDLDLDLDVQRRLSNHLQRLVSGDASVLTSAICKDRDPKDVLSAWDKVFNSKLDKMNSDLLELENSNRDKYGPRSISKPWSERISSVEDYYKDQDYKVPFDLFSTIKQSNSGKLRPLTAANAADYLKNSTNSGLPYYTRKSKVKKRTVDRVDYLLQRKYPCILFTRTQEGNKTRNVWGYPIADTLEEMRFYRPILDYQKRLPWRSALLGPSEVDRKLSELIFHCLRTDKLLFSGDVSSFDANVTQDLINASFYYFKRLFQYDYRVGLDRICERFSTIGLLTPDGVTVGKHGVPSGSTFTNEVDSVSQYLVVKSLGIEDDCFQIQGDDIVIAFDEQMLDSVVSRYSEAHLPMNTDKTKRSKNSCIYLQNLYHTDYIKNDFIGGIYPTYRALNRICYQERWSDFEDFDLTGIDYYSIRTISILENCKYHPLFRDLVEFVYRLDKYSLKFSRESVGKYDAMLKTGPGTGGLLENQYGDRISGINSFETVKILKQLR